MQTRQSIAQQTISSIERQIAQVQGKEHMRHFVAELRRQIVLLSQVR